MPLANSNTVTWLSQYCFESHCVWFKMKDQTVLCRLLQGPLINAKHDLHLLSGRYESLNGLWKKINKNPVFGSCVCAKSDICLSSGIGIQVTPRNQTSTGLGTVAWFTSLNCSDCKRVNVRRMTRRQNAILDRSVHFAQVYQMFSTFFRIRQINRPHL